MKKNRWSTSKTAGMVLLLIGLYAAGANQPASAATPWVVGDVFVGVSGGSYQVYDNTGAFKETLADPLTLGGFTTGCAFNPSLTKLYATYFSAGDIVKYDDASPHAASSFASAHPVPESIAFKADGGYFVGGPSVAQIDEYDAADTLGVSHAVGSTGGTSGTDWIDVAANQTTLFYAQEGTDVLRFDTVGGQLLNFSTGTLTQGFALRLLPPGDGSGGLLIADLNDIKRLAADGSVAQTYDVAGEDSWFSLNLDPNGTSFWSGSFGSSNFYRFNIATGFVEVGPINTGTASFTLFGICLKGEPTAAGEEDTRRMTGGGSVFQGSRVTHGFELHCDISLPNNLEINWEGNRFHLTQLNSATCSDDPDISEGQPVAGFDTFVGSGVGRLNGVGGATIEFTLTDAGEPGKAVDTAKFDINGVVNLAVAGLLDKGNHQAHPE